MIQALRETYKRHERWIPIASFICGFLFDLVMLRRVDEPKVLVQQAGYILVAAILIGIELVEEMGAFEPPRWIHKIWSYREFVLHFLLGTLLNSYTIFYFKSASAWTSFFFIAFLVLLLTLNEFKRFGKSQSQVHVAFLSLCLISYLVTLLPILLGSIGSIPFLCAIVGAAALFFLYVLVMRTRLNNKPALLNSHLILPFAVVEFVFVVLYFTHLIPPVPLSVKYMGIYHSIERVGSDYELTAVGEDWKFWHHGDQTFHARPGDKIHCFAQIFSPARFKDRLQVRWLYKDVKRGWQSSDAILLPVAGGREEGYRIVTKKENFQPGTWRVQIETTENFEVGRIGFEVVADDSVGDRVERKELR